MNVDLKKLTRDLARIVGREHAYTDRPTSLAYAKDTMPWDVESHNMPYAVVRPENSREISGILQYANKRKIPVHTHGSGTSLVGLGRPKTNCIVLDTGRMQKFQAFPERGYFEVEPGMHIGKLRKALAPYNALLPVFPGSELVATIGGSISVNTSAHAVDATICKPGDYVLGMEVVLASGQILHTGTESTRKPAGIEATKFLVGSEGLLCVITRIRMRLIPCPIRRILWPITGGPRISSTRSWPCIKREFQRPCFLNTWMKNQQRSVSRPWDLTHLMELWP